MSEQIYFKPSYRSNYIALAIIVITILLAAYLRRQHRIEREKLPNTVIVLPPLPTSSDSLNLIYDTTDIKYYENNRKIEIYADTINIDSLYKLLRAIY